MPAVTIRLLAAALVAAIAVSSAGAVGLGPLRLEGVTRTDRKGFYLTLINPYRVQERFRVYSIETDSENAVPRVLIPISTLLLGGQAQRRILVVDSGLRRGEVHQFRVCAERVQSPGKDLVHARVCSKVTARRLA